jgi:hypothetical protein
LAIIPPQMESEPVHARPLGHQPGQHLRRSGKKPDSPPNGNDDHTKEVRRRDQRGLRPPAYVLIALVIALVAILLLLAGVLFAPD